MSVRNKNDNHLFQYIIQLHVGTLCFFLSIIMVVSMISFIYTLFNTRMAREANVENDWAKAYQHFQMFEDISEQNRTVRCEINVFNGIQDLALLDQQLIKYFQIEEIELKSEYERIIKANQVECGKSCIERNGTWKTGIPYGRLDPCNNELILKEDRKYCDEPVGNGCHHVFEGYLCLEATPQHSLVISTF